MSKREEMQQELVNWIRNTGRFTAPYGVLDSLEPMGKGFVRSITFGVARISDIHLQIWSEKKLVMSDSRYGEHEFQDVQGVMDFLNEHYRK